MSNIAGTYLFKDKDPIIDVMRTLVQLFASIEGISFGQACKRLEAKSGVKESTMQGWFGGKTLCPQYKNVARIILALKHLARKPIAIGDRRVTTIATATRRVAA